MQMLSAITSYPRHVGSWNICFMVSQHWTAMYLRWSIYVNKSVKWEYERANHSEKEEGQGEGEENNGGGGKQSVLICG